MFYLNNLQNEYSGSGFSEIDPNKINLLEHPNVANVPWTYAKLTPGDCIYIPAGTNLAHFVLPPIFMIDMVTSCARIIPYLRTY